MWNGEPLDEEDARIIEECLRATVEGPFFPDWEFHTLLGFERSEIREIAIAWPNRTVPLKDFKYAVIGTLNNLTGYPHDKHQAWGQYISVTPARVLELLDKLSPPRRT